MFRGRRKGDPDTKSGLGKIVIGRAARRKKLTLLYAFLLRKSVCSKNWVRQNNQISNLHVIYAEIEKITTTITKKKSAVPRGSGKMNFQ